MFFSVVSATFRSALLFLKLKIAAPKGISHDKQKAETEPSKRLAMSATLAQTPEYERAKLLDSVECLQAVLYRFAPLLDSESVEVVTLTQAALKTIIPTQFNSTLSISSRVA